MRSIVAIIGCAVSSVVCYLAAWKICEAGIGYWPWFLLTGILTLLVSGGLAHAKHEENDITEL